MRHFWQGFALKTSAPIQFKKHVILLFWSGDDPQSEGTKDNVRRLSFRYPSVKVKVIDVKKDPTRPLKHNVTSFPTVVLLKDGREVDRLAGEKDGATLLEQLFRKAHT